MLRVRAEGLFRANITLDVAQASTVFIATLSISGPRLEIPADANAVGLAILALVACLAWPALLDQFGAYASQRRTSLAEMLARVVLVGSLTGLLITATAFAVGVRPAARFALVCSGAQALVIGASRIAIYTVLRTLRRLGRNTRNVLVVGSGARARDAQAVIQEHPEWGLRVIGFVDEGDYPFDPRLIEGGSDLAVHKIQAIPDLLRERVVDEVIVACPRSMLGTIAPVVGTCAAVGVPVTVLSDLFGDMLPPPRSGQFGPHPALNFSVMHHGFVQARIKRAIDALGAAVLLVLAAPILLAAAIAIRMNSSGPIFFRQQRCGLYGRRFTMLKLRTMHADAERRRSELARLNEVDGPTFKIRSDPRTTRVGRFLRRYSLDEIPQLWNVLLGEMSLVGPRPPIPHEVDQYRVVQRRRLSMRPGLTCLWQVNGRNEIGFEDWVRLDLEYIDNWSLILDLRILLRTLPAVLRGTGAS
jgi:exopolysaccharide biosynthesis polyprenyl glycosylphosphotransferase